MLQLNYIREHTEEVKNGLKVKNFRDLSIVDMIIEIDVVRRDVQRRLDDLLAEANNIAKEIGVMYKSGKRQEAESLKQRAAEIKESSKELDEQLNSVKEELNNIIVLLPNLPHGSVKPGKSADDNEIIKSVGDITVFDKSYKPHWDICEKNNLIDFECGSKITGSGFPVYRGKMAKFQRALINYFIDEGIKEGYYEVQPPYLVNEDSAFSTGQLPDKDGQMYQLKEDNLFLIPTAEVPVTNIFRNSILKGEELPQKIIAYSACFRREAGSYGKDVRGLNRLHQFDKVEIVRVEKPENSYGALEEMCNHVAKLIESLELPYRILRLCGCDLSFASALTYDFEVFAGGQKKWLEVSSVSNFETFQSNRMKLRYKDANGQMQLLHTLNGSALALPRIVAAIIENHQCKDGIKIPKALVPYTEFEAM